MSTFGFLCPPTPGHLNPLRFLAKELERRRHKTAFFQSNNQERDQEAYQRIRVAVGEECTRLTEQFFLQSAAEDLEETFRFMEAVKADVIIGDEFHPCALMVANHMDAKFIKIGCSYPRETKKILPFDLWLSQMPRELFSLAVCHQVGPLHEISTHIERKYVYVTMGTINNNVERVNKIITEATKGLQLKSLCVEYGLQIEGLRQSALTVCNAGMNTVLESLALGVPLVMIPIANDQDKIAECVEGVGAGVTVLLKDLSVSSLRESIKEVLGNDKYTAAAVEFKHIISRYGREKKAADLIEEECCQ